MVHTGLAPGPTATSRFNVRAYGIWINQRGEVLLSEERINGHRLLKFPGGGLEYGEGLADCLRREWREETGLSPEIIRHYYTTDYFQPSAFHPHEQVISIYYLVRCPAEPDWVPSLENNHQFNWVPLATLSRDMLTLPIDQLVAEYLRRDFERLPVS